VDGYALNTLRKILKRQRRIEAKIDVIANQLQGMTPEEVAAIQARLTAQEEGFRKVANDTSNEGKS
jgi:hypothetical protein